MSSSTILQPLSMLISSPTIPNCLPLDPPTDCLAGLLGGGALGLSLPTTMDGWVLVLAVLAGFGLNAQAMSVSLTFFLLNTVTT